jgi:NAD(P)H dehydrogenase (quinone)
VAREDLAEVAARVAAAPASHRNVTYELAGAAAITAADLARELDVPYEPSSFSVTRAGLDSAGLLPFQPAMLMSIYSATAAGFLSSTHSDLERLLAHSPHDTMRIAAAAAGA